MNLKRMLSMTVVLLTLMLPRVAFAQDMSQPLPIDPQVRTGKLENGLTYFIRHNEQPKDRAEFYIAQRVGSILEEENQRGLAHFLEHMCFNGTKNFPDKTLISYLESNGMRFGYNLNAYTGIDETVYTLMEAPTERQGFIDSCLLILHDWSGFVTLADEEIDKERGVITEEWRSRDNAQMRMLNTALPKIYPNNRYGHRLPIGLMSVVNGFKYNELRDYYHKWYRPDLQAIIVVGDVDVDYVEKKIKEMFADIPAPVNAAERVYFPVEDNDEPLVAIEKDKEATSTGIMVMFKTDAMPVEMTRTIAGVMKNYLYGVTNRILDERFTDLMHKPNPAFISASGYISNYFLAQTKDALSFNASVREGELDIALKALTAEIERIRQYGFTQGEYERARTDLLKAFENSYNERETRKNSAYANEYKDYFTTGGYIPGIEMEKAMMEQVAANIPLEVVNQMVQSIIGDKNMVLMLTAPDKEGLTLPTEAELVAKVNEYRKLPVEPIKDAVSDMKLMEEAPKAGKVTKREDNLQFGTTRLTLSNGMVVYLKTTDYKKNQISLTAVAPGGTNAYLKNAEDLPNIKNLSSVVALGGVGKFDNPTLTKALTGRSVSASGSMGGTRTYFSGISTLEDMETFFQLLHLRMTQPRQDADAFANWRTNTIEQIKNMESNPMVSFQDSLIYALYDNNPQMRRSTIADIEAVNYDRVMQIWKERIADLGDLQLYFIGNVTPEQLIPYLEKYVASVPTKGGKHDMCKELVPTARMASMHIDFKKELATPMAMVLAAYTGKLPYTLHNELAMEVLGGVMDQVYTATVREDEGGTFGVSSGGSFSDNPEGETIFQIFYQTDPEKVDKLNKIIYAELEKVAKNGPDKEMFDKTILNMKKDYAEDLKKNGYWLDHMIDFFFDGRDFQTDYEKTLNGITPADVQKIAQEILKQDNHIEVIIRDAKKAK